MKAIIEPGFFRGNIAPPPSKSMTQRAYAAALLHAGNTIIHNAGKSADEEIAFKIIQQLGAEIQELANDAVKITSNGINPVSKDINCGESGLAARLFTPIAAISERQLIIKASGSLLSRPMEGFKEVLPQLNVALTDFTGYLPLTLSGALRAQSIKVDASGGSQFLSGLLMALCACATEPVTIEATNLKSRPYIDLTLLVLAHFGKPVTHNNYRKFYIDPKQFSHKETIDIVIEADWSSAANFLVAGAIAGEITIHNLKTDSRQADKAILEALKSAGADVVIENEQISIKSAHLRAFEFDATHCPDLFPILSILAACCGGESAIRGVHRLFHKESNRVESVTEMLQDFAVSWSVEDDTLFVTGEPQLQGTVIDSYQDHRIVMAATVGALKAGSRVDIMHAEAINKSYPAFFRDFILCGGKGIFINDEHPR